MLWFHYLQIGNNISAAFLVVLWSDGLAGEVLGAREACSHLRPCHATVGRLAELCLILAWSEAGEEHLPGS